MKPVQELKEVGLRPTFSRMSILEVFSRVENKHLTAEEIHQHLQDNEQEIGLATVYRVLTQFEHAGLLVRHKCQDGSKSTYELTGSDHHDHMVCLQCHKIFEFNDPIIEERKRAVAAEAGFELQDHLLYLYVACLRTDCPNR
ncbi:MAG: ferric iron uptake transcriptional regulator [Magnetococcales bacterium]|nr:ferric iron uptake transcriptional regulator [Magnetococcales bacterium]